LEPDDAVDIQEDVAISVVVMDPDQRDGGEHTDPELLPQLTGEPVADALSRLQLATWKLPEPALVNAFRAARDQDASPVVLDRPGGHVDVSCRQGADSLNCGIRR
jgi:hypothetical protein